MTSAQHRPVEVAFEVEDRATGEATIASAADVVMVWPVGREPEAIVVFREPGWPRGGRDQDLSVGTLRGAFIDSYRTGHANGLSLTDYSGMNLRAAVAGLDASTLRRHGILAVAEIDIDISVHDSEPAIYNSDGSPSPARIPSLRRSGLSGLLPQAKAVVAGDHGGTWRVACISWWLDTSWDVPGGVNEAEVFVVRQGQDPHFALAGAVRAMDGDRLNSLIWAEPDPRDLDLVPWGDHDVTWSGIPVERAEPMIWGGERGNGTLWMGDAARIPSDALEAHGVVRLPTRVDHYEDGFGGPLDGLDGTPHRTMQELGDAIVALVEGPPSSRIRCEDPGRVF